MEFAEHAFPSAETDEALCFADTLFRRIGLAGGGQRLLTVAFENHAMVAA
jgi:hypothetical protein